MPFVVDSSVTLAWCFRDELTPEVARIQAMLVDDDAIVPAHWPLEIANVLVLGERKGRISKAEKDRLLGFLQSLPLQIDSETMEQAFADTAVLATVHQLTTYDAAYLELARRLALPIATLDQKLRTAATVLGVPQLLA